MLSFNSSEFVSIFWLLRYLSTLSLLFSKNSIKYFLGTKLYIWRKKPKKIDTEKPEEAPVEDLRLNVPKLSDSKLKELSWSLDIDEKLDD